MNTDELVDRRPTIRRLLEATLWFAMTFGWWRLIAIVHRPGRRAILTLPDL